MAESKVKGKYDHWFDRDHLRGDLKNRSIKGGVSTVSAQGASFILNTLSMVVMARLLLPADYGLIAMVTAITGFVLNFKDLGLAQAVIHREGIAQPEVSKLFWLVVFISGSLAIIIALLAPVMVYLYDEPRLLNITFVYAFTALLGGFSVQHGALMRRQMQFKTLAAIQLSSSAVSIGVGIALAYLGVGYWALVSINVSNTILNAIQLWWRCNWRPTFTRVDKSIMDYVKFGADISGFNAINYFSRNLDNILIGKFLGSSVLGLYNRAYALLMIPITQLRNPLNAVGIPAMSSLDQNGERFRSYYKEYVYILSFFSMPIIVFLTVCAYPVIELVLGPKWMEASEIFQLLSIVAFIQPVASTRGMVLMASGQSRRYLYWGLINAVVVILAFFVGINWGVNGLVIAYGIANYTILIPSLVFCYKNTSVRVKDFMREISSPASFALLGGVVTYFVYQEISDWRAITILAICFPIFTAAYLLPWLVFPVPRKRLFKLKGIAETIFFNLRRRKKS